MKRAQTLGADLIINYKTTPDWDQEVQRLTDGIGADMVLELGGGNTLAKSLSALRVSGKIQVIDGIEAEFNVGALLGKRARIQGVSVGSRESFEAMNRAITQGQLRPVIDRAFPFDEANAAHAYLESGGHFDKVVIEI